MCDCDKRNPIVKRKPKLDFDHNRLAGFAAMNNKIEDVCQGDDQITWSDRAIDFFCPVCVEPHLYVGDLVGTQICGCVECKGFLIDSATFGSIIQVLRGQYQGREDIPELMDVKQLDLVLDCPACQAHMYTHPYHGPGTVVVNSCGECQLNWLDAGELTKIVRAPGRRG